MTFHHRFSPARLDLKSLFFATIRDLGRSHTSLDLAQHPPQSRARAHNSEGRIAPRKDQGEDTAAAAVRKGFEETGYRCRLTPIHMPTRAPMPDAVGEDVEVHYPDVAPVVENCTEPFAAVTNRRGTLSSSRIGTLAWSMLKMSLVRPQEVLVLLALIWKLKGKTRIFDVEDALRHLTFDSKFATNA
ncbi:hypothetical protein BKA93DRAFT_748891 [Sparassis latifolia]|uniref:Nudix hydrolase domain-containing protein n=1 Tax=Sparassis crispa TaxID=139825 RepID=A0A401G902_9APHY|nr:hypothetical protein SCP_0115450 [Sparassis crispa]GBE78656.1 hypothetical protein SCP_0115450 [Sparassis crispa]